MNRITQVICLIALYAFSFLHLSHAKTNSIVAVGKAEVEKSQLVIYGPFSEEGVYLGAYAWVAELMKSDFLFYKKYFNPVTEKKLPKDFGDKKSIIIKITKDQKPQITLKNITKNEILLSSDGVVSNANRALVHQLANEVYQKIRSKKSIFNTKIFYVCETKRSGSDILKELFVMDFDGKNSKQLTNHGGVVISPSISFDNNKVIYSLIASGKSGRKNIDLYLRDLTTGKTSLISSKKGMNSGAAFMPGDNKVLLTLSHRGNADIYSYDLSSKKYTQITKKFSTEVDPSISFDGRMVTFLSDRPGKPMIYTLNPSGPEKNVKRIGWVGKYNATPRFSPDGKEIAFSSWVDNRFDIFRLNANGSGLVRLTKDFGSNEDPTYSNDGEFIAFTSQRVISRKKAVQKIYIMDRDGEILTSITEGSKICTSPRWSN